MDLSGRKLYLYIGLGAAVFIVLATLAYSLFFRAPSGTRAPGGEFPAGEGRTVGNGGGLGTPEGGEPSSEAGPQEPYLFALHDKPVVSSVVFSRSSRLYARFMEEGTGHVYEYDIADKKSYRISNTSVPKIQEAFWSVDGNVAAFRYEDGGALKAATAELATSTIEGSFRKVNFLPAGIRSLALSPDGSQIFYIIPGSAAGTAQGVVANRDGSSPRAIFTSKLPRWFVSWPTQNSILIASPWSEDGGISYRLNPQSGALSIVHSTQGLFLGIAGSPFGDLLVTDPVTRRIAQLDARTGALQAEMVVSWPSFCAFAAQATSTALCAELPSKGVSLFAEWSRGEYDFGSNLALIELSSGSARMLIEPAADRTFDIVNPSLAPDASYATFKNRVDGMLWGVSIK